MQCIGNADCTTATAPICDATQCRACAADSECASGACGEDGACIDPVNIIYLHPTGTNVAPCSMAAPCRSLEFAVQQVSLARFHLVMTTGAYTTMGTTIAGPTSRVVIHGAGSTLSGGNADYRTVETTLSTDILDLSIINSDMIDGTALRAKAPTRLHNVNVRGATGLSVQSQVTATNVDVESSRIGVTSSSGSLVFDGVRIHGGTKGIFMSSGVLDITNMAIFDTDEVALDLTMTNGAIKFSTIAHTSTVTAGVFAAHCTSTEVTFHASILWYTGRNDPAVDGSCNDFTSSIVGPLPTSLTGVMNVNPMFAAEYSNNFHLDSGSPARDQLDLGPSRDVEGVTRPGGSRFDLGAYEAP